MFCVVTQVKTAKPDAFAIARAVHDQTSNATRNQVGDALEILNLLSDIETVEEHHGRHFAATVGRFGMHIKRRQAGAVIRNLYVLYARPLEVLGGVTKAVDAAPIGVVAVLALRLQEALADMVIGARALQILRAAHRVAFGDTFAATVLDGARLARPLAEPGVVVADDFLEPQPDAIDLADFRATPGRHVQPDQQPVRPAIIFREISERQFFQRGGHARTPSETAADQFLSGRNLVSGLRPLRFCFALIRPFSR